MNRQSTTIVSAGVVVLAVSLGPATGLSIDHVKVDPAIQEELSRSARYPWFDSQTDEARVVELDITRQPKSPARWDFPFASTSAGRPSWWSPPPIGWSSSVFRPNASVRNVLDLQEARDESLRFFFQ